MLEKLLGKFCIINGVLALIGMPHQLDVVDEETAHLRNLHEVINGDLAGAILVEDHKHLKSLLHLLPVDGNTAATNTFAHNAS